LRAAFAALTAVVAATAPASPAAAHVIPQPSFVETQSVATLALEGPNERDEPMTGFRLRMPSGITILSVRDHSGWTEAIEDGEVVWADGSLAPGASETFHVELEAPDEPGALTLDAEQLYAGGEVVRWDVSLTVVPGPDEASGSAGWALGIAAAFLVITSAIVLVAWRGRNPPPAEG